MGARPRPLAERGEAFLVDIDDDGLALRVHARVIALIEIEHRQPQRLDRQRIERTHQSEGDHIPGRAHGPRAAISAR